MRAIFVYERIRPESSLLPLTVQKVRQFDHSGQPSPCHQATTFSIIDRERILSYRMGALNPTTHDHRVMSISKKNEECEEPLDLDNVLFPSSELAS